MTNKFTTEEFIRIAKEVHGDKYDYSQVDYVGNKVKVCIICPIHGKFFQTPHQHLLGSGCPRCKYNRGYKLNYEPIEGEIWMPIKDFEEFYKISNKGRLMSSFSGKWSILSNVNSKGWYFTVVLRKGEIKKTKRVHRLVYESFVGEIPNDMIIHHINGNKQDNRLENLSLLTKKEHAQEHKYSNAKNGRDSENVKKERRIYEGAYSNNINAIIHYNKYVKTKKIIQCDLKGNYIATFNNGAEASIATGVCQRNILQVANKEPYNKKGLIRKQAGGFIWKFKE